MSAAGKKQPKDESPATPGDAVAVQASGPKEADKASSQQEKEDTDRKEPTTCPPCLKTESEGSPEKSVPRRKVSVMLVDDRPTPRPSSTDEDKRTTRRPTLAVEDEQTTRGPSLAFEGRPSTSHRPSLMVSDGEKVTMISDAESKSAIRSKGIGQQKRGESAESADSASDQKPVSWWEIQQARRRLFPAPLPADLQARLDEYHRVKHLKRMELQEEQQPSQPCEYPFYRWRM
jgi:hypothetical protein